MIQFVRLVVSSAVLASFLLTGPATLAQSGEAELALETGDAINVLVTFRIGKLDGEKRVPVKSYDLVVTSGSSGSSLLSGARVPFPSAGSDEDGRSFVYQNVGFSTTVRALVLDKKRIRLVAEIEDSRVSGGEGDQPPTVETRQLSVNATLTDGVPLELTRVEGITDQSGFVEVEAKILQ